MNMIERWPSRCVGAARGSRPRRGRGAPDRGRGRGRYRDALGVMPPVGPARRLPRDDGSRDGAAPARPPLGARARALHDGRGDGALRHGRRARPARAGARRAARARRAAPGRHRARVVRPGRPAPAAAAPRWRRCARRSSPPSRRRSRASSPRGTASTGARACGRRSCRCRRSRCPSRCGSPELLPRRVPDYRPEQLDQLCATGELVWVGAGLDRVAVYFREDAGVLGAVGGAPRPEGRPRRDPGGARPLGGVLVRSPRPSRAWRRSRRCRRSGISSGRAR